MAGFRRDGHRYACPSAMWYRCVIAKWSAGILLRGGKFGMADFNVSWGDLMYHGNFIVEAF